MATSIKAVKGPLSSKEFHNLLSDIGDLIKSATPLNVDDLAEVKDQLSKRIETMKESVNEVGGAVADQVKHAAKSTDDYVHAKPWQVMGVCTALGFAAGMALSRRGAGG